jgi:hypothetical protein
MFYFYVFIHGTNNIFRQKMYSSYRKCSHVTENLFMEQKCTHVTEYVAM